MPRLSEEKALVDRLWAHVEPLLPEPKPTPKGGQPRVSDRACLEGIIYVLRNGVRWRDLPSHFPSGLTCWRRHSDWTVEGIWETIWHLVLQEYDEQVGLQTEELFADATFVPAQKGGRKSGKLRLAKV